VRVDDDVALMGGINTLSFVPSSPSVSIKKARQFVEQGARMTSFNLGSDCVVPCGARLENLSASRGAADQSGSNETGVLVRNR
jgi:hypothetical protein